MNRNITLPIIIILISFAALFFISQFPSPRYQDDSVSAKFFPSAIAIIQIIICAFIIAGEYFKREKTVEKSSLFNRYSVFGAVLLIGYAVLIYVFGYLLSTLFSFAVYLLFFRSKNIWYYVTACIFTTVIYYVFSNVFYVVLPEGIVGGLNS